MYLTDEQINIIKTFLEQQLNPYLIVIFGSAITGQLRPDSDVDIAFLSDRKIGSYQLFLISQKLADQLGREVHLIDLEQASTVLQAQIVGKGQIILDKEPIRRQEYYILVLKMYARLNEERAPIFKKIKERGSIYAR
ncbi:MAG: type VII toxin-antitoxin system MntA family adenylyltransferase antitoxin [Syntrophomonadaceae bacterium]|jgi:predicted nucleotidyltransferase